MKVRDLIARLQQHDPDMVVMLDGYEGGLQPIDEIGFASVRYGPMGWCGDYETTSDDRDGMKVVYLPRETGSLSEDGWSESNPPEGGWPPFPCPTPDDVEE